MLGFATTEMMKMPGVDLKFVTDFLLHYMLASLRIGAFLLSAPLFGARWMPLQVRVIMAFALAQRFSFWRSFPKPVPAMFSQPCRQPVRKALFARPRPDRRRQQ